MNKTTTLGLLLNYRYIGCGCTGQGRKSGKDVPPAQCEQHGTPIQWKDSPVTALTKEPKHG